MGINIKNKKLHKLLIILIVLLVVISLVFIFYPYPFFGPFTSPPSNQMPNCSREYRFNYDTKIDNKYDFISFLKEHQFNGSLYSNNWPTRLNLVPNSFPIDHINNNGSVNNHIDIDKLEEYINVENSNAIFSNEKIYSLGIQNSYFNDTCPLMISIKMSETGYVSILYCAGV